MFVTPARGADESELRRGLDRFTGEWEGEVQVRALDGFVLRTVPATRRYTWRGAEQIVETTLKDNSGDYATVARQVIRLGRLEANVTRPSLPEDRYLGEIRSGSIIWANAEGNRRDAREQIVTTGGSAVLETSSVEPIRAIGFSGVIRLEGRFQRTQPPEAAATEQGPADDVEALRRARDEERAARAESSRRAIEAQQRVTAAESRVAELEKALESARADAAARAAREAAQSGDSSRRAASESEIDDLRSSQETILRERDTAVARVAELERVVPALNTELEAAKSAAAATSQRMAELERMADAAVKARDAAEELSRSSAAGSLELTTRVAAADEAVRLTTTERDELAARVRQMQRDNEVLVRGVETLQAETETLRNEVSTLRARLEETGRTAGVEQQELERLRRAVADESVRREALEQEVATLRTRPATDVAEVERERAGQRELMGRLERESVDLRVRIAELETAAQQSQRDNERLLAANQRIEQERAVFEARAAEVAGQLAVDPPRSAPAAQPSVDSESGASITAAVRDKLISEVQQMERRVIELESDRNAAREQLTLVQRQADEARRLRDDTLVRFQTVVSELNAMREEKERLARANVSLQAEVRDSQRSPGGSATAPGGAGAATAATTADGRTADMVIAAFQIIGVTRGEIEDKVILNGRVYRNGDTVEAELGIIFDRIDDNALVFHDRRGREYRRRF